MNFFPQDVRFALRSLARTPAFALAAILTLAIGIGAATAIFSVLDAVVLRQLPYPEADRLVYIDSHVPTEAEGASWGVTDAAYFYLRENNRVFEDLGAYGGAETGHQFTVVTEGGGVRVDAAYATASLFEVLRARPAVGRLIQEQDDRPGQPSVAVLGHDYWLREFGGDPAVVGRTLELEGGAPIQVLGVLEPGVRLPHSRVDIWVPLGLNPSSSPNSFHGNRVIGRLRADATLADAAEDLALLTTRFPEAMPAAYSESFLAESGFVTRATPLRARVLGGFDKTIWILMGSVGLVLLIAYTNVVSLFLVRAEARRRERALRLALGGGRVRLALATVSEGLLVTLGAATVGILLANGALRLLLAVAPTNLPRLDGISVSGSSIAFAFGVAMLSGGILGAFSVMAQPANLGALRDGGRGVTHSRRGYRVRGVLVVAQMALALVLLATAGLMVRSFHRLNSVDPGFDPRDVLTIEFFMPSMLLRYRQPEQVQPFYRELMDRVAAVPGVQSVSAGRPLPLSGDQSCSPLHIEGRPVASGEQPPCIPFSEVTPGFFRTLGIQLQGREMEWPSFGQSAVDVVVTRALAERLWPGEDPIGKGIRSESQLLRGLPYGRVVGVTGDLRSERLDRPSSEAVFFPLEWGRSQNLVVRGSDDLHPQLADAIRSTLRESDPAIAVGRVRTMNEVIAASPSFALTSVMLLLLAVGAGVGVLVGAIGLFSMVAYVVGQRRVEIGVRMALGAQNRSVTAMIMRQSMRLSIAGAAIGLLCALATTHILRGLLFEVSPTDPLTLLAVTLLLLAVSCFAAYLPTQSATRTGPMIALRAE